MATSTGHHSKCENAFRNTAIVKEMQRSLILTWALMCGSMIRRSISSAKTKSPRATISRVANRYPEVAIDGLSGGQIDHNRAATVSAAIARFAF